MIEVESVVKEWGSSLGIVIPNKAVKLENIKPGEKVRVVIYKESNVLQEAFGALKGKWKKSTAQILKEVDEDLWAE